MQVQGEQMLLGTHMRMHAEKQHCLGTVLLVKHQPCFGTAFSLPGVWLKLSSMSRSSGSSMVKRSLLVPITGHIRTYHPCLMNGGMGYRGTEYTQTMLKSVYPWEHEQSNVLRVRAPALLLCKLQAEVISLSAGLNGTAKL